MKRRFGCLTLVIILCLSFTSMAFANSQEYTTGKQVTVENQIEPRADGYYTWELTSKSSPTTTYGSWKEGCRKYTDGSSTATLAVNLTTTVSNTYTGILQVSIAKLSSYVGLNVAIGKSWSVSVSDSEPLAGKSKGTWAIEWRPVYNSYKVTQTKYHVLDGSKTEVGKEVVTVNEFKSISYRLRKLSSADIARIGSTDYE